MNTDSEEYVSVVSDVTDVPNTRLWNMKKQTYVLKQIKGEIPLDIRVHDYRVVNEDWDKNYSISSGRGTSVPTDRKPVVWEQRREENVAAKRTYLFDNSSVDWHSESQNTAPSSQSQTGFNPGVVGEILIS